MPVHINDASTWRQASEVHINDVGTWRQMQQIYVNISGVWTQVFVNGTPLSWSGLRTGGGGGSVSFFCFNNGTRSPLDGEGGSTFWVSPVTNADNFSIRFNASAGVGTVGGTYPLNTWQPMNQAFGSTGVTYTAPTGNTCSVTCDIALTSNTSNILQTNTFTIKTG